MKENNQDRRNNRSRRRFRHDHETPRLSFPTFDCCICHQPILEMATALAFGTEQEPAHFDCVLNSLTQKEALEPKERLVYLGSGTFAVILDKENFQFEIKRKIPVEDAAKMPEWRKEMKALIKQRTGSLNI